MRKYLEHENRPVARGCEARPPKSAKRSTFSHKMGQKLDFSKRVKGDEVQKVHCLGPKGHILGGPAPPKKLILATGLSEKAYTLNMQGKLEQEKKNHHFSEIRHGDHLKTASMNPELLGLHSCTTNVVRQLLYK